MKNVIRFGGTIAALGVVMFMPGRVFGESAADASWAKMAKCAAIADDNTRHSCTDDVLRAAGLLEEKATARRKSFGLQQPAPPPAASAPPANASASSPRQKEKPKDEVEVTLAKVDRGGDGKLVLTTSDGAVWHQVESDTGRLPPKQGQTMKIEARSLGSFMCQTGKYVSFRCYRSQ